jgi:hypothetical protein
MHDVYRGNDPPPVPPVRPGPDECCDSGCNPCIFDLYQEELDRYRAELTAWQQRQSDRQKDSGR